MRTVKVIDEEIGKLQKTIAQLEADRVRNVTQLEEAKSTREKLSLTAVTTGGKAARNLEEARLNQRHVELELEDVNSAINQANRQLEVLRAERPEAEHEEIRQKLLSDYLAMEAYIEKNPDAVLTAAFCRDKWIPYCRAVQSARARLGLRAEIPNHLPVKFFQATFSLLFGSLVTRPMDKYRNKTFVELFRQDRPDFTAESSVESRNRQAKTEAA